MDNYLYISIMLLGAFTLRTKRVLQGSDILSAFSAIAYYSLIIYGFLNLVWWHTIIIFITTSLMALLVNNLIFMLFVSILRLLQIALISTTVVLWLN